MSNREDTETMTSIHEIAARDLRIGDMLSAAGAYGLDSWYDTDEAGRDATVTAVKITDYANRVLFTLDNGEHPLETLADVRVVVTRTR